LIYYLFICLSLQFSGKLRAILSPLIAQPPLFGAVSVFLLDTPKIDFNLTGMGEMVELPGLMYVIVDIYCNCRTVLFYCNCRTAVRSVMHTQIAAICVLPNQIYIPLIPTVDVVHMKFPEPDVRDNYYK
jgi:Ca2+-dependent lipid-binding protein